ncbi:hypothetical protein Tco_1212070 [Tanacetum coccineum]
MSTLVEKSLSSGGDNKTIVLEKHLVDFRESQNGTVYDGMNIGRMILASVEKGPRVWPLYENSICSKYRMRDATRVLLRFTLLLNDMNIYKMPLEQFQVNTKFLNTLPDEWSKFVTDVKLVKDLHTTNVDQLHAYLQQHERHANEVRLMQCTINLDHLALVASHQLTSQAYQYLIHTSPKSLSQHSHFTISDFALCHFPVSYYQPIAKDFSQPIVKQSYHLMMESTLCYLFRGRQTTYAARTTRNIHMVQGGTTRETTEDPGLLTFKLSDSLSPTMLSYQAGCLDAYDSVLLMNSTQPRFALWQSLQGMAQMHH